MATLCAAVSCCIVREIITSRNMDKCILVYKNWRNSAVILPTPVQLIDMSDFQGHWPLGENLVAGTSSRAQASLLLAHVTNILPHSLR